MKEQLPLTATLGLIGQRVTSAAPSLSPTKRYLIDRQNFSNYKHDKAIAEGFQNLRNNYILDGSVPMDVAEAQVGKPMSSEQMQKRLVSLNPNFVFQVSPADKKKIGIYIVDREAKEGRRFIMGMEHGWMPQYTIRKLQWTKRLVKTHPPEYEMIPEYAGETRGWMKVLAVLIRGRYISKAGAERVFGLPSRDSQQWKTLTEM